jgi:hypothetical protein
MLTYRDARKGGAPTIPIEQERISMLIVHLYAHSPSAFRPARFVVFAVVTGALIREMARCGCDLDSTFTGLNAVYRPLIAKKRQTHPTSSKNGTNQQGQRSQGRNSLY